MKIVIFAHYDKNDQVADYVVYYLQELHKVSNYIIFVTTAKLAGFELTKLSGIVNKIIVRENIGYDFYSYKIGIQSLSNLFNLQQLILCNDSCFGPLYPLAPIFAAMDAKNIDFWGMSMHKLPKHHLQSYFLVFNPQVIHSLCFNEFWESVTILNTKKAIILTYEVGLSTILFNAGFKLASYLVQDNYQLTTSLLLKRKLEILYKEYLINKDSHFTWKFFLKPLSMIDKTISLYDYTIINYQFPFLKKSLLLEKWIDKNYLQNIIQQHCNYPLRLIV